MSDALEPDAPEPDALERSAATLADARKAGEPGALAEALARHANELILRGRLLDARDDLDEAATLHRQQARAHDESRCLQLAASLCRLAGDPAGARRRAEAARDVAGVDTNAMVSAWAELGEIGLTENDAQAAAEAYTRALELGATLGPNAPAEAALLRRRAAAHALADRQATAAADLAEALVRLAPADDAATVRRVQVELATAYQDGGEPELAAAVVDATWPLAEEAGDHGVLADLALLRAALALGQRKPDAALAHATTAREHALAARAPQAYIAAAITLGQVNESTGDRAGAYAALATGWATLADLLGPDLARQAFQPPLLGLRQRWGATDFDTVKQDYEARQRRAGGRP